MNELPQLLGEADVVLCLPLTDGTRGIIGTAELATMRADAVIVNVGRGPLIDQDALYEALSARRIGGAVIDVWYNYPSDGSEQNPAHRPFGELSGQRVDDSACQRRDLADLPPPSP